jgi:hypothetical protein
MVAIRMIAVLSHQYGSGRINYEEYWTMIEKVIKQEQAKAAANNPLALGPQPLEDSFDNSWDEAINRTRESIARLKALHAIH